MSRRAQQKERLRQERLEAERAAAAEGRTRLLKRAAVGGIAALAIAGIAVAVASSGSGGGSTKAQSAGAAPKLSKREAASLPRPIARNIREANQVVDGSVQTKLASLKGVPVVVNQWASWCPNCKSEFPFFQRLSQRYRSQVAFVGLDSQDSRSNAESFLRQFPVDYPSIYDRNAGEAASIGGGQAWPTTVFFDASGQRTFVHIGGYATEQTLDADIQRYARPG
jgi:cytochrome c biogenesis protein CcmG/thiol:disulfide interchange protein DsbE